MRLHYWKYLRIWCLTLHFYNLLHCLSIYIYVYCFRFPYPIFSSCFPFLIAFAIRICLCMTFIDVFFIFSFLLFSPSIPLNKNVDQQKQLKLIYDRFKEEVNLHLQDCKSTVEDLEADQIEIKGALEKQSMKTRCICVTLFCI